MYRLIVLVAVLGCAFAQLNRRQPTLFNKNPYNQFNNFNYKAQPQHNVFVQPAEVPTYNKHDYLRHSDQNAAILKSTNDISPDGHFEYNYETSNGIAAQAVGTPKNFGGAPPNIPTVIQGSYSYVAPDGTPVSIGYVADEYGYRAVGDAIPTPPPIPEAILRSLRAQGINLNQKK